MKPEIYAVKEGYTIQLAKPRWAIQLWNIARKSKTASATVKSQSSDAEFYSSGDVI
ncbi:MAG: hypothetical protein KME27_31330 [Lyngbya sp. HA4199-MV5]|nr:hypothetical protein [Lyngbya sp. HA4199-MV5]